MSPLLIRSCSPSGALGKTILHCGHHSQARSIRNIEGRNWTGKSTAAQVRDYAGTRAFKPKWEGSLAYRVSCCVEWSSGREFRHVFSTAGIFRGCFLAISRRPKLIPGCSMNFQLTNAAIGKRKNPKNPQMGRNRACCQR